MSEIKMKYGKFKGRTMEEIPSSYLLWIAENVEDGRICYAADSEYQDREKFNTHWEDYN